MDRCAILVDAGYLLAEGGKAFCGTRKRSLITCDYPSLAAALEEHCRQRHGLSALRTYWYDAASDGIPSDDHLVVAELPRVKLRMGRLSGGRQKGVDSLIVHDLITLAYARAVASMYLLGGDEDLREGVAAAQRLGVQVSLLGIDTGAPNQSPTLIREADEHILLPPELLRPHFGTVPGYETPASDGESNTEASDGDAGDAIDPERGQGDGSRDVESAAESSAEAGEPESENAVDAVREAGDAFARAWADRVLEHQLADILFRAPRIPTSLDVQLLVAAEERLGASLRERNELRYALREAFWNALRSVAEEIESS